MGITGKVSCESSGNEVCDLDCFFGYVICLMVNEQNNMLIQIDDATFKPCLNTYL